jgi:hypothetical protein
MTGKPFGAILAALRVDSGPPLFYLLNRALGLATIESVRLFSVVASLAGFFAVVASRHLGERRWIAAVLLAVYPPAVYLGGEARSYALCGAFAGTGLILLERWFDSGRRRELAGAVVLMVVAAYAHYYGVLLFPLVVVIAVVERRRVREAVIATAAIAVAYAPGFALALTQPPEAMTWLGVASPLRALGSSLRQLAFAAEYPPTFVASPPVALQIFAATLLLVALFPTFRDRPARRFMLMTLTPIAILVVLTAGGRSLYYPMRFESVIAVPLCLWIATALRRWRPAVRTALVAGMIISGLVVAYVAILAHARAVPEPRREAAQFARLQLPASAPIVVSGLGYLEVLSQRSASWNPVVRSLPAEQARHPGWRADVADDVLEREVATLPMETFVWIGEQTAPEARALKRYYDLEVLFARDGVLVARSVRRGQ